MDGVLPEERLPRRHFHRRAEGHPRPLPQGQGRRPDLRQGPPGRRPPVQRRRGIQHDVHGQQGLGRPGARGVPVPQVHRQPVHAVHACRGACQIPAERGRETRQGGPPVHCGPEGRERADRPLVRLGHRFRQVPLPTGTAPSRARASMPRPAAATPSSSTTATCTPATISSIRNTGSGTSRNNPSRR